MGRRHLLPVIVALRDWGDQFLFPGGRRLSMVDTRTDQPVPRLVVKSADGEILQAGDMMLVTADRT